MSAIEEIGEQLHDIAVVDGKNAMCPRQARTDSTARTQVVPCADRLHVVTPARDIGKSRGVVVDRLEMRPFHLLYRPYAG